MRTSVFTLPWNTGFDWVFDTLGDTMRTETSPNWPPFDVVRESEHACRLEIAVPGFAENELTITSKPNLLVVTGTPAHADDQRYLHRGISRRAFERRFTLADHVEITDANLANGLLTIAMKRELPEELKPRRIAINGHEPKAEPRQIEGQKHAA